MPFDFFNYLTLAEELATRPDEASKRSSISRAYYSVYNIAFERAERTAGPYPGGVGFHQWCWEKYTKTPDIACKQIGLAGDRMKRRRVKADYKPPDIPRLDDEVQLTLTEARQFHLDISALNATHPLP
jgi:hypothetical protein